MESLTLLVPNYCGGSTGVYAGAGTKMEDLMRRNNVPIQQIDQFKQLSILDFVFIGMILWERSIILRILKIV